MVEKPIPDNIKPSEVETTSCVACGEPVVVDDLHTDRCTFCDTICHESCVATHEEECDENEEEDEW